MPNNTSRYKYKVGDVVTLKIFDMRVGIVIKREKYFYLNQKNTQSCYNLQICGLDIPQGIWIDESNVIGKIE